jgi:4-hydroxyphenylpyruvate dioxygenase-like putative hemolysin
MHPITLFTAEEINTGHSSLRFEALSNESGTLLINISEPSKTSMVKSPMQRFLEHHNGPNGVQHIALESSNIFASIREMRAAKSGFGFMPHPGKEYYRCASHHALAKLNDEPSKYVATRG